MTADKTNNTNEEINQPAESEQTNQSTKSSKGNKIKLIVFVAAVLLLWFFADDLGINEKIRSTKDYIDGLGPWGPLVFGLIYIATNIAMIPGSVVTAMGGALFGSLWGTIIVSISSTIGAACCFLIARYIARDAVSEWVSGKEKFRKLDKLTETHGGWIVAITRLVPVFPFNLLNYGFGLTKVNFWTYVFFSWLCMLPGTIMYVVGTDAIVKAVARGEIPWILIGVVVAMIIVLSFIGRIAHQKLSKAEKEAGVEEINKQETSV